MMGLSGKVNELNGCQYCHHCFSWIRLPNFRTTYSDETASHYSSISHSLQRIRFSRRLDRRSRCPNPSLHSSSSNISTIHQKIQGSKMREILKSLSSLCWRYQESFVDHSRGCKR